MLFYVERRRRKGSPFDQTDAQKGSCQKSKDAPGESAPETTPSEAHHGLNHPQLVTPTNPSYPFEKVNFFGRTGFDPPLVKEDFSEAVKCKDKINGLVCCKECEGEAGKKGPKKLISASLEANSEDEHGTDTDKTWDLEYEARHHRVVDLIY